MSAALETAPAPQGWTEVRPGEWRHEREGALSHGCRVRVSPDGDVEHVAMTAWSARHGGLSMDPAEVGALAQALAEFSAWLGGQP